MKILKKIIPLFIYCIMVGNFIQAQTQPKDSLFFEIDIPLFDYPFNLEAEFPTASMTQTVAFTKSFYYATHYGIELYGKKHFGKNGGFWSKFIMSVFDFAPIPFSNVWLHEEYHRTILSLHNIKSKNTHWSNSVKGVKDEDLVRLKLLSPADMVREATSGNEGNLEFVSAIQKDVFFNRVNTWNYGLYWGNYLVNSFYLFGSTREGSKPLVNFKNREDEKILNRDANGYDPINAAYDLFNPFEPYAARGIHPSGEGIDRYVEFNNLSPEAQQFLRTQFSLSFLNFLDMNLFGIDEIGKNTKYNFSVRHHLTTFGYMIRGNVLFKNKKIGGLVSPIVYRNSDRSFFGLDLELNNKWGMIRVAGWQQPENQLYRDTEKRLGGLIELRILPPMGRFKPYLDLGYKTKGWVAGNPFLDNNFTFRIGGKWQFKKYFN